MGHRLRNRSRALESHRRRFCRVRVILPGRKGAAYIVSMKNARRLKSIPDDELIRGLSEIMRQSRRVEADLVAHIAEVDVRRLYAREAVSSMHVYRTEVLRLTDFEAYLRITAARASREYPMLLTMLRDGRLHLTAVARLASHLTQRNWEAVLKRAANRSKREIEEAHRRTGAEAGCPCDDTQAPVTPGIDSPGPQLVPERVETSSAERPEEGRAPTGPGQAGVRAASASPLARRARVEPLAPGRYRVEFTASAQLHDKLTRLQALMRSSVPGGDLAVIIEEAVTEKLERLEARRFGKTKAPRKDLDQTDTTPTSRHIPAAVRRVVHERDGGRCTYVDARRKTLQGPRSARVPPPQALRPRWRPFSRDHRHPVRRAQCARGRA